MHPVVKASRTLIFVGMLAAAAHAAGAAAPAAIVVGAGASGLKVWRALLVPPNQLRSSTSDTQHCQHAGMKVPPANPATRAAPPPLPRPRRPPPTWQQRAMQ